MADMVSINRIAKKHGLLIIEDAAQAFGSKLLDYHPGNLSDVVCFSFHPLKNLNAAGDGGLVATNNYELIEKVNVLKNHGQVSRNISHKFGFVSRLDSLQAAILNVKLDDLDSIINRRGINAKIYEANLSDCNIQKPIISATVFHSYHLYVIETQDRLGLYNYLREHKILAQIHYIPVHLMPYYRHFGWKEGDMPNAEKYYMHCISLPMFPTLTDEEQQFVIEKINSFYND